MGKAKSKEELPDLMPTGPDFKPAAFGHLLAHSQRHEIPSYGPDIKLRLEIDLQATGDTPPGTLVIDYPYDKQHREVITNHDQLIRYLSWWLVTRGLTGCEMIHRIDFGTQRRLWEMLQE